GKLKLVFGCAGMRDKQKRKQMGQIANEYADEIYLAPEDPRYEDPKEINTEILSGMGVSEELIMDTDQQAMLSPDKKPIHSYHWQSPESRRAAIHDAIKSANP